MRFFVLRGWNEDVTKFLYDDLAPMGEAPRCPACGEFVGAAPLVPPIVGELEPGRGGWTDFGVGVGGQVLFSERLRNAYEKAQLSGVHRFDLIEVLPDYFGGHSPPAYFLATVSRSRAVVDDVASQLERIPPDAPCIECRSGLIKRAERIVFEPNTWSGEDIFEAIGLPGITILSECFRDLVLTNSFSVEMLIPADEYSFDFYPWELSGEKH